MSAGKVEIGCFRTYPASYIDKQKESKNNGGLIPQDK